METPWSAVPELSSALPPKNLAKRKYTDASLTTQGGSVEINVHNLQIVRDLGEGAYGKVKLVVDKDNPNIAMAVKIVDLGKHEGVVDAVRKEALLHRIVRGHENVLKYLNMRITDQATFQLFLEYADGGELFDQIEPDVGMPSAKACFFFRQLMQGLEFIHSKGIAHRDIKPENLLLTKGDVLKISDFGMATLFCHEGRERYLNTKCGTVPYAAPEVFSGRYRGPPIDVWSAGVVLVTMLSGELPWDSPFDDCELYQNWVAGKCLTQNPWPKIRNEELSLLKAMLRVDFQKRASVGRIMKHPWVINCHYKPETGMCDDDEDGLFKRPTKRPRKQFNTDTVSQPPAMLSMMGPTADTDCQGKENTADSTSNVDGNVTGSFTQPEKPDALLLTTQFAASQGISQSVHVSALQKLVRRMTRFCVTVSVAEAMQAIEDICTGLALTSRRLGINQLVLTTSCAKRELSFMATVYEMRDVNYTKVLVDFRRSKGDGLEFKRMFVTLRNELDQLVCKQSRDWLEKQGLICSQRLDALHLSDEKPLTKTETAV